jgi:hypothetical protein
MPAADGTYPKENLTVACVRAHAPQSKISAFFFLTSQQKSQVQITQTKALFGS